jgi:hypothetical protein
LVVKGKAVQTINTNYAGDPINWFYNAPINYDSPDGSDIVYLGTDPSTEQSNVTYRNTLVVCDDEVDQTACTRGQFRHYPDLFSQSEWAPDIQAHIF